MRPLPLIVSPYALWSKLRPHGLIFLFIFTKFFGGYPELLKLLPWTWKGGLTQVKLKSIRDIYIESYIYYRYLQMLFLTKRILNLKRNYFSSILFWFYNIYYNLILWHYSELEILIIKKIDISVTLNFLSSPPFNLSKYFFSSSFFRVDPAGPTGPHFFFFFFHLSRPRRLHRPGPTGPQSWTSFLLSFLCPNLRPSLLRRPP